MALGIMPSWSWSIFRSKFVPIVCVLPEPVCVISYIGHEGTHYKKRAERTRSTDLSISKNRCIVALKQAEMETNKQINK